MSGVVTGSVGEHRAAAQVPDDPDVVGGGVKAVVDRDETVEVEVEAEVLDAEPVAVRDAPGGDEEVAARERAAVGAVDLDVPGAAADRDAFGVDEEVDPVGVEAIGDGSGDFRILAR